MIDMGWFGRNWVLFASIGLALAVLALVLLAIGPLGWRLGWWHFRFAFFCKFTTWFLRRMKKYSM